MSARLASARQRTRRIRALFGLWLAASAGCGKPEPPPSSPPAAPEPTHYLGEPFAIGGGRCTLVRAERTLVEQRTGTGQVVEDVLLIDTRFRCEDAAGRAVPAAKLLEDAGPISWLDDNLVSRLRSPRVQPEHVFFAVPTGDDGLPRPRRYDAHSGEPKGARERGRARVVLTGEAGPLAIAPWPRGHGVALDRLLDPLARALAGEAAPSDDDALRGARALFADARALFAPRLLVVRSLAVVEGQPRLTMELAGGRSDGRRPPPQLAFELDLTAREPRVLRLLDLEGARAAVACARDERALAQRIVALERTTPEPPAERCNALGTLLPGRCELVDPALLAEVLRVGSACAPSGARVLAPADPARMPEDFEVRLVRGRSRTSLDRSPRYQLTLGSDGHVRFQGEHWVSRVGPSAGRTSRALLGALHDELAKLGYFDRPDPARTRCRRDEYGDFFWARAGGRERAVRDRDGCRAGFSAAELDVLRRAIERVGGVEAWIRPGSSPEKRDEKIWYVAAE